MSSISRQYNPPSCSLEITAQTSPLSRWTRRPILQSVNFLLSFQELSGHNHEPLEIRGDREQLQVLSETVTHYVQSMLGQSLATSALQTSAELALPSAQDIVAPSITLADGVKSASNCNLPYLRTRSLAIHDLVLGSLSTNAEDQTVPLRASQLFDLVSALDDCAAELEMLPLPTPTQRPAAPIWASSAAVIVLVLGVTTATLQLTQQDSSTQRDWVTSSDRPDSANQPAATADGDGNASAPPGSSVPKSMSSPPVQPPSAVSPPTAGDANVKKSPEETSSASPFVAVAPRQEPLAPAPATVPQAQSKPPAKADLPSSKNQGATAFTDKPNPSQQAAPIDQKALRPKVPKSQTVDPPQPAAESEPVTADASESESFSDSDHLNSQPPATDHLSRNQLDGQAPSTAANSRTHALSAQAIEIRQYMSQHWQAPTGLTQSLQYQLTLNTNGSLQQVKPLDQSATKYLSQVPFPAVNQPFIAPFKSSPSPQVRLVLKPDGTVQTFVDAK